MVVFSFIFSALALVVSLLAYRLARKSMRLSHLMFIRRDNITSDEIKAIEKEYRIGYFAIDEHSYI